MVSFVSCDDDYEDDGTQTVTTAVVSYEGELSGSGGGVYGLALSDRDYENGVWKGSGDILFVYLVSDASPGQQGMPKPGKYTMAESGDKFTILQSFEKDSDIYTSCFGSETGSSLIEEGYMVVEKSNNIYTIKTNLTTGSGKEVKLRYTGKYE